MCLFIPYDSPGSFPADLSDLSFQVTDTGFLGIAGDHSLQGFFFYGQLIIFQAVFLFLLRKKKLFCDMQLFVFRIAGYLDDLHTIQKRPRDIGSIISGSNKQYLRKIQRQLHIMIGKMRILLRIQHLQHGCCRISFIIAAHLIDLIQKHQRISDTAFLQCSHDAARHRAYIRSSVSSDLSLIADTAKADTHILFVQCFSHRTGNGSLSCSRRSHQTDNGTLSLLCQAPHG